MEKGKTPEEAFADIAGKEKIKEIKIGDNTTEIGAEACRNLPSLKKVTLGKNVKKIGKKAFVKCKKLKNLTVKSKKLTKKSCIGKNAFTGTNKKLKIKIKVSKGKAKASIIKVFKQKKIGYKSTWTL
ncbi:leucine-rich repeat protein [Butyrivibrio sp. FC2001]|uniref:leucine-rich repeat protein n=1 Tax=Butyrivibrio sp. FC2001 TaxID=1280671 RepID=UPI0009DC1572